jgi:hypothetical protein
MRATRVPWTDAKLGVCVPCAVLLTQASRQGMLEMVGITVDRLQQASMQPQHGGSAGPKLLQSPQLDTAARDAARAAQAGQPVQPAQPAPERGPAAVAPSVDGEDSETGDLAHVPTF